MSRLDYERYESYPVKVRFTWIQKILSNLGYEVSVNGQRDKQFVKALKKFQKSHGLSDNAVINKELFIALLDNGGDKISINTK